MNKMVKIFLLILTPILAFIFTPISNAQAAESVIRWQKSVVYVESQASSIWPVLVAAENMDDGSVFEFTVVRRCPASSQCVRVTSPNDIPGNAIGLTVRTYNPNNKFLHTANTKLENNFGKRVSYRARLALVCHELGHSVGLTHTEAKSCMQGGINDRTPTSISPEERKKLDGWYRR